VELEALMSSDGFWDDQESAQATVAEVKRTKAALGPLENLESSLDDLEVMIELAKESRDKESAKEVAEMDEQIMQDMEKLEFRIMLGGEYDVRDAYLTVQAGAGGTESCDWAEMLLRMYSRWAERSGFDVSQVARLDGEEAGVKWATLLVRGDYAYGYLRAESGVHRLVRLSPFDSQNRRQTSFAAIEVMPDLDDAEAQEIRSEDLRVDTYRAGGAGGQHVNKTDSAVRLTHLPSGIVVACQSERSQHKNRATAMKMLAAKLIAKAESERDAEMADLQGEKGDIGWGHQIRSYVLHPYQMVKDHRTNLEVGNTASVLDGEIQPFIETYLRSRR
jgi:peptide chain release factor 2